MFQIEVTNQQSETPVDSVRLEAAVEAVLQGEGVENAAVSVAVVDDPTIHELNRRYLDHDYPTDVLSFTLDGRRGSLDGEVVSAPRPRPARLFATVGQAKKSCCFM